MTGLHSRIYDTSAMLRFANGEGGNGNVEALLKKSAKSAIKDNASALSAFEILFTLGRVRGKSPSAVLAIFDDFLDFLPADLETCQRAAFLKLRYRDLNLSMADAIILQTGIDNGFEVVTCDKEWAKVREARVVLV